MTNMHPSSCALQIEIMILAGLNTGVHSLILQLLASQPNEHVVVEERRRLIMQCARSSPTPRATG